MAGTVVVKVPDEMRPKLGPIAQRFDAVCRRGEQAMQLAIVENAVALRDLCTQLCEVVQRAPDPLEAGSIGQIMLIANDIRGMASPMGSELSADIADAVFDFCARNPTVAGLPQPLILLLAESCRRLIGYRRTTDGGVLESEVKDLLDDVESKLDEGVRSPPLAAIKL